MNAFRYQIQKCLEHIADKSTVPLFIPKSILYLLQYFDVLTCVRQTGHRAIQYLITATLHYAPPNLPFLYMIALDQVLFRMKPYTLQLLHYA